MAEETCGAEVKLLLEPAALPSALKAFNADGGTVSSVALYDTGSLALLSQGVVLRVRSGASSDITVKLRAPRDFTAANQFAGLRGYKCEMDVTGEATTRSYSITAKYSGPTPATGQDFLVALSAAQKQLLEQSHVTVDWPRVVKIADIKATEWEMKDEAPFSKLTLELWEWPTGKALELSTKAADSSGQLEALRNLANSKGLAPSPTQKLKTAVALEAIMGSKKEH